jgi:FG-GAP repeat
VSASDRAYVVFGAPGADRVALSQVENGERGFSIEVTGNDASIAGDVDGDGLADLLVGVGRSACLIFGKADGASVAFADVLAKPGEAGLPLLNSMTGYRFTSVSGAGDVNGDGLADFALGAQSPGLQNLGDTYILFGWDARGKLLERDRAFVGGPGDDIFEYTGAPFINISGGNGTDTLRVVGHDLTLDLHAPAPLHSIEVIDLTGDGNNTLLLDDAAVRSLPQSRPGLGAAFAKTLVVVGDAGDRVFVDRRDYAEPVRYAGRDVYQKNGAYYGLELSPGLLQ